MIVFVFVCVLCVLCLCKWACVRVRERGRENTVRESFDSTAFLSWRHLLPSPNLSVYQAKMLSETLLRQLDNPPLDMHTYALSPILAASIVSASLSTAKPNNIQKSTQTHTKNTNTHASSPTHPPLRCPLSAVLSRGSVAGTHRGLRCEKEGKKGRRHNNRLYHQTSTLPSLVIQTPSTRGPNVFTQRDSHTFSCQIGFTPRFAK